MSPHPTRREFVAASSLATTLAACSGGPGGITTCEARYIAGCDGAHSSVRTLLGIGLPGGTYSDVFYVADVDAEGPVVNGELLLGGRR